MGGSSSSNNIGPMDLINIKRVAWGVRELEDLRQGGSTHPFGEPQIRVDEKNLEELVRSMVRGLM